MAAGGMTTKDRGRGCASGPAPRPPPPPTQSSRRRRIAPGDESGNAKIFGNPAVNHRCSLGRGARTAGGGQHRVSGGHVPLASGREARINVGRPFGDSTELDRGAGHETIGNRQSRQEVLRLRVEVGTTEGCNQSGTRTHPGSNGGPLVSGARRGSGRKAQAFGALALDPAPEKPRRRGR